MPLEGRGENGIWAHRLDLAWSQGERRAPVCPTVIVLGLTVADLGLVAVVAGRTERLSKRD